MATKKATTRATKATTKDTTVKVDEVMEVVDEVVEEKVTTPKTQPKKEVKKYVSGDRVPCKSITAGKLVYYSTKTHERYEWSNYGDITDVLYEDLLSMKSAKSQFIYKPLFVIADEDLLADPSWSKIQEFYDQVEIVDDAEDYLNQTPERLKQLLLQAPDGVKNTIKITASQMINKGELDSIRKIKVLDEVLGTEFASFIN